MSQDWDSVHPAGGGHETVDITAEGMGVEFDLIKGESEFVSVRDETVEKVDAAGLAVLSEGALVVDLSDQDMPPLFLRKGDGATVYATRDLAAARDRWDSYEFDRCLYVVDMGQTLYFRQLFEVLSRMGEPYADRMEHVAFGVVRIGGRKTGSRKGSPRFSATSSRRRWSGSPR